MRTLKRTQSTLSDSSGTLKRAKTITLRVCKEYLAQLQHKLYCKHGCNTSLSPRKTNARGLNTRAERCCYADRSCYARDIQRGYLPYGSISSGTHGWQTLVPLRYLPYGLVEVLSVENGSLLLGHSWRGAETSVQLSLDRSQSFNVNEKTNETKAQPPGSQSCASKTTS